MIRAYKMAVFLTVGIGRNWTIRTKVTNKIYIKKCINIPSSSSSKHGILHFTEFFFASASIDERLRFVAMNILSLDGVLLSSTSSTSDRGLLSKLPSESFLLEAVAFRRVILLDVLIVQKSDAKVFVLIRTKKEDHQPFIIIMTFFQTLTLA